MAGFTENNFVRLAIILHAIEVTEKIERPRRGGGSRGENTAPNFGSVRAANRFAIFVSFDQLETDRAHIRAEGKRFELEQITQLTPLLPAVAGIWIGTPAIACELRANRKTRRGY